MTAKQAKRAAVSWAKKHGVLLDQKQPPKAVAEEDQITRYITLIDEWIEDAAKNGRTSLELAYQSEKKYRALYSYLTDRGFHVSYYTIDGGYAIGDLPQVGIYW